LDSDKFASASNEEQYWWVGISTHIGDALTYKIITKTPSFFGLAA
jgi:hypothetical protein